MSDEDSRRPVLALRSRLRFPTFVVALALFAGPAASASCLHALAGAAHGTEAPMAEMPPAHAPMGEMATGAPAHETDQPCHDAPPADDPAPAHAPDAPDCASPCCLAEAPAEPAGPVVVASQAVPAPLAVAVEVEAAPVAPPTAPVASPPLRTARLHAVFQQFLI